MTVWDFIRWLVENGTASLDAKLGQIQAQLAELKELVMGAVEKLQEFATAVNAITNAQAASITALVATINALKAQLVGAASEAQVTEILAVPLASLTAVANTLTAVAAGNEPTVPPVVPPVTPPVDPL